MKDKDLQNLTASIVVNQLALNYNEELKHTRFYKHNLKNRINGTIKELEKVESKEFDLLYDEEDELTHQISSNIMTYIEFMINGGFSDFMLLANMQIAWSKNPKSIEGIINKVLNS